MKIPTLHWYEASQIHYTILEKSNESQHQILSNIIYEYFDKSFYSLTPQQRKEKYLEESKPNIDDIKKKFAEFQKFLGKGSAIKEEKKFVKEENANTQNDDFTKEIDEVEEISMDEIDDLFE